MNIQQTLNTNKLKNQYYRGIQLLNSIMIVQNESGKTRHFQYNIGYVATNRDFSRQLKMCGSKVRQSRQKLDSRQCIHLRYNFRIIRKQNIFCDYYDRNR